MKYVRTEQYCTSRIASDKEDRRPTERMEKETKVKIASSTSSLCDRFQLDSNHLMFFCYATLKQWVLTVVT